MKMTTEEIIADLRNHTMSSMRAAADRLEELQQALYEIVKQRYEATVNQQLTVRSETSRLEIAAMAMQGMLAASSFDTLRLSRSAIEAADALIAAAKESK